MASFNIWGACVSRDILQKEVLAGNYEVKRWISFISPITAFTEPYKDEFDVSAMPWGTGFFRRNMQSDIDKDYFKYLFAEPSDYIIVDMVDSRMDIVEHEKCMLTVSNQIGFNWDYINNLFGEGYWKRMKMSDFSEKTHCLYASKVADKILEKYRPDQIILHIHYGVKEILDKEKNVIRHFPEEKCAEVSEYNYLNKKINDMLEEKFKGCHVIRFPDNVLADGNHQWGLLPLHYERLYYEYGERAMEEVLIDSPDEEKNLEILRLEYSRKFLDLR